MELFFIFSLVNISLIFIKKISDDLFKNSISCPNIAIFKLSSNKIPLRFIPALISFIFLSFIFSSNI